MRLSDRLTEHFRLTDAQKAALAKLGIKTVRDLLRHFPARYEQAGGEAQWRGLWRGKRFRLSARSKSWRPKKGGSRASP
jgi:RecG-like helicase